MAQYLTISSTSLQFLPGALPLAKKLLKEILQQDSGFVSFDLELHASGEMSEAFIERFEQLVDDMEPLLASPFEVHIRSADGDDRFLYAGPTVEATTLFEQQRLLKRAIDILSSPQSVLPSDNFLTKARAALTAVMTEMENDVAKKPALQTLAIPLPPSARPDAKSITRFQTAQFERNMETLRRFLDPHQHAGMLVCTQSAQVQRKAQTLADRIASIPEYCETGSQTQIHLLYGFDNYQWLVIAVEKGIGVGDEVYAFARLDQGSGAGAVIPVRIDHLRESGASLDLDFQPMTLAAYEQLHSHHQPDRPAPG